MPRHHLLRPLGWIAVGVIALLARWHGLHAGLIYPDGYEYLLMAKGIAAHLQPTIRLGPGGALFVPPIDAALKPLFPALVALLSPVLSLRHGADAVTAAAGAGTVVLAGLVAARLAGSWAGALAAGAALLSPALAYWSGFAGPDQLAPALALGAALALLHRRAALAGVLGALCGAARPEWVLVLVAFAVSALLRADTRPAAGRALRAGAFTLAAVIALLRPPLAAPPGGLALLLAGIAAAVALQLAAAWSAERPRRALGGVALALAAITAYALSGRSSALAQLLADDWPLLALAAGGLVAGAREQQLRLPALAIAGAALLLGAAYGYRNPGSERYLAELVPLACVAAGLAARRPLPAGLGAAAVALTVLVAPARAPLGQDPFAAVAPRLSALPPGRLITAAPIAYGYLLPDRTIERPRAGARGLIVLDAVQRAYDPGLRPSGEVVARIAVPDGFERPDGWIDRSAATVVRGAVRTG